MHSRNLPHVSPVRLARLRRLFGLLQRVTPAIAARIALDRFLKPTRRVLDDVDAPLLAQARLQRLDLNGRELQVYEWGNGPVTVLLVHGWGSHAPRYSAFVQAIIDRGWRALAFDAPGHGQSIGKRSSLPEFRHALDAVIERYGPVHGVVAHSLGALAIAGRLADRSVTPLRAAVLISVPRDVGYLLDSFLQMIGADRNLSERVHARFASQFGRSAAAFSAVDFMSHIDSPVLLVHDRVDDVVPLAQAEELAMLSPRSALHITQGMGHSGLLRDAATVGVTIAFLAAAVSGPADGRDTSA